VKKIISILLGLFLIASFAGCSKSANSDNASDSQLKIVATIFPAYDFARAISKDTADVQMLIKPGMEIHSYDPSPADILEIQNCDVFIYNGGEADAWVDSILESMDTSNMTIIRMMDFVDAVEEETKEGMQEEEHEHEEGEEEDEHEEGIEYDEHIWTSPKNAVKIINGILKATCEADDANKSVYEKNAEFYIKDIEEVDEEIQQIVNEAKHKIFIIGDRFPLRYFADEFGLDYRAAFNGCSTETEASAATIAYLIDSVKENKVSAVFYIELSNQNIAKAISEQTGTEMLLMHSCHNVTADEFAQGATYVSIMKQNAVNLKKGLN